MRKKICSHIKEIKGNISIATDEFTTLRNKPTLIVYLKCESSKSSDSHFIFLDLVELPDQNAETVVRLRKWELVIKPSNTASMQAYKPHSSQVQHIFVSGMEETPPTNVSSMRLFPKDK